jgi:hypothetical protein
MRNYFIAGALVIIVAVAGVVLWNRALHPSVTAEPAPVVPAAPVVHEYASSTFSVTYPDGYTVDESYAYEGVPKKPIHGVKFRIPLTMATGTNLSLDSGVSVESLPRALRCTGDIYIYQTVRAHDETIGTRVWSVASTSDAAAGNLYEEYVYALKDSKPCIAFRYMIHGSAIGNYSPGTVTAFSHDALMTDFDKIRDSVRLPGEISVVPTASTTPTTSP